MSMTRQSLFIFKRWSGAGDEVEAASVSFEPSGHVAFWDGNGRLIRAVKAEQVHDLEEKWT